MKITFKVTEPKKKTKEIEVMLERVVSEIDGLLNIAEELKNSVSEFRV